MALGAKYIADYIAGQGTKRVFVYPGGTIAPILEELNKLGVELFVPKHEQGAGFAAIAAARLTGQPQVCLVTSGPGVTNAVTPIADAYFDSVPVLFITGQVGTGDLNCSPELRQRGFQEVDTVNLCQPVTKAVFQPRTPDAIPQMLHDAYKTMTSGRKGPVVLDMPMDVQRSEMSDAASFSDLGNADDIVADLDDAAFQEIADKLAAAERPLIIAGNGVLQSGAINELRTLARSCGCAVSQSLPALGVYPTADPMALGFHGHTGSQAAGKAIQLADVVLAVGTRMDVRQTGSETKSFASQAWIARVDLDSTEIENSRIPASLNIKIDAKAGLAKILSTLEGKTVTDKASWRATIAELKTANAYGCGPASGLKPQAIIEAVNKAANAGPVVVTSGVGSHQQWAARHFDYDLPERTWLTSAGHGTMGFDLPAAIGAALAAPEASIICFVGDGSLQMNIQELATIAEHHLPIKIFALDNARLAIVSQFQLFNWQQDLTTGGKKNPDFAAIAKAYGLHSLMIDQTDQLDAAVQEALSVTGPCLIHCKVDQSEDVSPMLLPGQTMDKMWHREDVA